MKHKKILSAGILMFCILLALLTSCGKTAADISVESACIGAMTGSTGAAYVEKTYPSASLQLYDAIPDAILALQTGRLDYVITAYTTAVNFVRNNDDLEILPGELTDEGASIAIGKTNEQLLANISAVLERFRADGTLETIVNNWIKIERSDYVQTEIPRNTAGEVLTVGIAANREPMCFVKNNEIVGLDCELIERIAFELGMRVEYMDMQFSALIAALESGKVDTVISNLTPTAERREVVNFTGEYFINPQVFLIAKTPETAVVSGLTAFLAKTAESARRTFIVDNRWKLILSGLRLTILISLSSLVAGSAIGALICGMRRSKIGIISGIAKTYIRVIQGLPAVTLLMLLFYVVLVKVDIDGILVAILGFSLNFAAYTAEMFRTGIEAVDKGQHEAAMASGFSKRQIFMLITLPQSARHILPVFKGEFISMVKMTAFAGYIAVQDLTKASDIIRSQTFESFFPLIATAAIYFIITYIFITLLNVIEIKIDPKRRKRLVRGVSVDDRA